MSKWKKFIDSIGDAVGTSGYYKDAEIVEKYTGLILSREEYNSYREEHTHLSVLLHEDILEDTHRYKYHSEDAKNAIVAFDVINSLRGYKIIDQQNFKHKMLQVRPEVIKLLKENMNYDYSLPRHVTHMKKLEFYTIRNTGLRVEN